jgi:hypothetical protein
VKSNQNVQIRQQDLFHPGTQGLYGHQGGYPYPGLEDPFFGGGAHQYPVPYQQPQPPAGGGGLFGGLAGGGTGTGAGAGAGGSSSFNLNQIKGIVDKMGGIDGIVGTMTRVQKVVASFQQMAPMIKLLLGSFGGAKASANSLGSFDSDSYKPRRRAKKGKRKLKKYRTNSGKTWTPKSRKRR